MATEGFTAVSGYDVVDNYTDAEYYTIDPDTKEINFPDHIQPFVVGEADSHYIFFRRSRTESADGIDLGTKQIYIHYKNTGSGATGKTKAVNVETDDDYVQFGWLAPGKAAEATGKCIFAVWFTDDDGYCYKTRDASKTVYSTSTIDDETSGVVPATYEVATAAEIAAITGGWSE